MGSKAGIFRASTDVGRGWTLGWDENLWRRAKRYLSIASIETITRVGACTDSMGTRRTADGWKIKMRKKKRRRDSRTVQSVPFQPV